MNYNPHRLLFFFDENRVLRVGPLERLLTISIKMKNSANKG